MADSPAGLRPMRPIQRHPFVEETLPVEGTPDAPSPPKKTPHSPAHWSHAQLMQDLKCDGGTGIYAKAKAANGGKDPIFKVGRSVVGSTDTAKGVITLGQDLDRASAAQVATFELTNLSNRAKFAHVFADAAAGKLDREQYARAIESGEYEGIANATKAFASCGASWGAAKGAKGFYDVFAKAKNFNDYYKNYLAVQDPQHTNHYRSDWDHYYKAVYDAAHPPHKYP